MKNSALYESFYRSLKLAEKDNIEPNGMMELPKKNVETDSSAPAGTKEMVLKTLDELQSAKAHPDENKGTLGDFDINSLPLIDVVKQLKVDVIKASVRGRASYNPVHKTIEIGGNRSKQTFLHELAHAVDDILLYRKDITWFEETVAELSAVVLCKTYSIPFSISHSKCYLVKYIPTWIWIYTTERINAINRVVEIVDYIKQCKMAIDSESVPPCYIGRLSLP